MDVRCERCRAQYAFDDDQITPAGLTVQCNGCGHVFMVKKKELIVTLPLKREDLDEQPRSASSAERQPSPPPPPAPPPSAPPVTRQVPQVPQVQQVHHWTIRQVGGQELSFSELNTLQRWIVERRVAREDEVTQGDGTWVRLGTLAELQSFFEVVEAADRAGFRGASPSTSRYPAAAEPQPPASPPPPPPRAPAPPPPRAAASNLNADLDEADLQAVGRSSRSRSGLLVGLLLLVAVVAVAYVFVPTLFGAAPPPKPVAVAPPPPPPPPAPEPKPAPPPEVKPPEPEPVPEPVVAAPEPTPDPKAKPKPKAKAPGIRQQLAEARKLREGGAAERALDLYGKVAAQDPENAEALAGRGLCYFDLEQYAPAEASLQEALRLSPSQPDALMGLAETYRASGRKAEAIAMFERYLAAHPGGDEAALARNAINQLKEGP